jgi:CHAT domain-containing protein/Tfp pilus assembly protein PilF
LAIREQALGPTHPEVAFSLHNLARLYRVQGRYAEAAPLVQRALAIQEQGLGPTHPEVATSLNNLAVLYQAQGRYAEAEPLVQRALVIQEQGLGPTHPEVATSLHNLALLYRMQGRYAEAEPLAQRALALDEQVLGPTHPHVATSLYNLALLYQAQGRYAEALGLSRKATTIHRKRGLQAGAQRSSGTLREQQTVRYIFVQHVDLLERSLEPHFPRREMLLAEAFEVSQLAQATSTAETLTQMAARFSAGTDTLTRTVRAHQDALTRWQVLQTTLVELVSSPPDQRNPIAIAQVRADLHTLDQQLTALDAELARDFPAYTELTTPQPMPLRDAQRLLRPEEALLVYLVDTTQTYLWVVRAEQVALHRLDKGQKALNTAVAELRRGLTAMRPFDVAQAHALYQQIVAPAEPFLDGVRHLLIVAEAGLQSLPFSVLVTAEPSGSFSPSPDAPHVAATKRGVIPLRQDHIMNFTAYREVSWLAKHYALSVLPSVSSLRALRHSVQASKALEPFIGFGDPLLAGHPEDFQTTQVAAVFSRGPVADVEQVRNLLPLPDTADELQAIARSLEVGPEKLYLREQATETQVRSLDLSRYRILAFATHGLMAGEFTGLAEPALVLTPPPVGSPEDDGLLTASEVATLKLDAEWVLLSACNTAAADGTPGAEGLSGLAKAFFYAGTRALLVSHWSVFSDATVQLTTRMFAQLAANPGMGRAEALRQAMLSLLHDPDHPRYAHPVFWAPFMVVGEGGTFKTPWEPAR